MDNAIINNLQKSDVLAAVTELSSQNLLSKDEVVQAFERGKKNIANHRDIGISDVLYFIGALIVFSGIAVLIGQNWDLLNIFTRILATLGLGVATYFIGVLLNKEEKYGAVGNAFHLIAALCMPVGLGVVFDQFGYNVANPGTLSVIAWLVSLLYLASFFVFKKSLFTFFSIAYVTWFFFAFTNFLIASNPYYGDIKFYEYRFFVVGLSYCFLGHYLSTTKQKNLTEILYAFGSIFSLGAGIALGGWMPSQNVFWEIIFPGLIVYVLYLSVHLKSKNFLTFGTIFLMLFILKITGEYFSGTLGWPFSLMICGIALISIGYYAFTLNKKYLMH